MIKNQFKNRFKNKSNVELKYILNNPSHHVEEAILAAREILESRENYSENYDNTMREEGKFKKENYYTSNDKANSNFLNNNSSTDDSETPELYSKRVIMSFSILFSTLLGAILMFINLKKIGKQKASYWVLFFSISHFIVTIIIIIKLEINSSFSFFMNIIGALILTEYFWNKYIGKRMKYKSRGWVLPGIISLILLALYFILQYFYG